MYLLVDSRQYLFQRKGVSGIQKAKGQFNGLVF